MRGEVASGDPNLYLFRLDYSGEDNCSDFLEVLGLDTFKG